MEFKSLVFLATAVLCSAKASTTSRYYQDPKVPSPRPDQDKAVHRQVTAGTEDSWYDRAGIRGRVMIPCNESFCCPKTYHYCCDSGMRCCDFLGRRSVPSQCFVAK